MNYGWKFYFEPTPKNVSRWLLALKSVVIGVGASAYVMQSHKAAFWILLAGGILNEFGLMFSQEPDKKPPL